MKKNKMGSKGIDPLIAEVVIIAVILAMGGTILAWYSGLLGFQTDAAGSKAIRLVDCGLSEPAFYDLQLYGNKATIIVRNGGYSDDIINSAFIFSKNGISANLTTVLPVNIT